MFQLSGFSTLEALETLVYTHICTYISVGLEKAEASIKPPRRHRARAASWLFA